MGAQAESRAHLRKAREFLEAARLEMERDLYTAAASSAVLAGINAKDAICLRLTGRTSKPTPTARQSLSSRPLDQLARLWSPPSAACSA